MKSAVLLSLLVLAGPTAASAAERLVVRPYPAEPTWVLATDGMSQAGPIQEYIPPGQTLEDHHDILSVQTFPGLQRVPPAEFLKRMLGGVGQACLAASVNGPVLQQEDGANVAYGQAYCGQQIGKPYGLHIFFKVIQGQDAIYVINREFRVPASKTAGALAFAPDKKDEAVALLKAEAAANSYLVDDVFLCLEASTSE
eukprot:gene20543-20459_t